MLNSWAYYGDTLIIHAKENANVLPTLQICKRVHLKINIVLIYELGAVCIGPIIFKHIEGFVLKYSHHETPIDALN